MVFEDTKLRFPYVVQYYQILFSCQRPFLATDAITSNGAIRLSYMPQSSVVEFPPAASAYEYVVPYRWVLRLVLLYFHYCHR